MKGALRGSARLFRGVTRDHGRSSSLLTGARFGFCQTSAPASVTASSTGSSTSSLLKSITSGSPSGPVIAAALLVAEDVGDDGR